MPLIKRPPRITQSSQRVTRPFMGRVLAGVARKTNRLAQTPRLIKRRLQPASQAHAVRLTAFGARRINRLAMHSYMVLRRGSVLRPAGESPNWGRIRMSLAGGAAAGSAEAARSNRSGIASEIGRGQAIAPFTPPRRTSGIGGEPTTQTRPKAPRKPPQPGERLFSRVEEISQKPEPARPPGKPAPTERITPPTPTRNLDISGEEQGPPLDAVPPAPPVQKPPTEAKTSPPAADAPPAPGRPTRVQRLPATQSVPPARLPAPSRRVQPPRPKEASEPPIKASEPTPAPRSEEPERPPLVRQPKVAPPTAERPTSDRPTARPPSRSQAADKSAPQTPPPTADYSTRESKPPSPPAAHTDSPTPETRPDEQKPETSAVPLARVSPPADIEAKDAGLSEPLDMQVVASAPPAALPSTPTPPQSPPPAPKPLRRAAQTGQTLPADPTKPGAEEPPLPDSHDHPSPPARQAAKPADAPPEATPSRPRSRPASMPVTRRRTKAAPRSITLTPRPGRPVWYAPLVLRRVRRVAGRPDAVPAAPPAGGKVDRPTLPTPPPAAWQFTSRRRDQSAVPKRRSETRLRSTPLQKRPLWSAPTRRSAPPGQPVWPQAPTPLITRLPVQAPSTPTTPGVPPGRPAKTLTPLRRRLPVRSRPVSTQTAHLSGAHIRRRKTTARPSSPPTIIRRLPAAPLPAQAGLPPEYRQTGAPTAPPRSPGSAGKPEKASTQPKSALAGAGRGRVERMPMPIRKGSSSSSPPPSSPVESPSPPSSGPAAVVRRLGEEFGQSGSMPIESEIAETSALHESASPPKANIAHLARLVYPLIKRMLQVEKERTFGRNY